MAFRILEPNPLLLFKSLLFFHAGALGTGTHLGTIPVRLLNNGGLVCQATTGGIN
jgi:hypothetical protein